MRFFPLILSAFLFLFAQQAAAADPVPISSGPGLPRCSSAWNTQYLAGCPCNANGTELGVSKMDVGSNNLIACIYDKDPSSAVWKIMTINVLTTGTILCPTKTQPNLPVLKGINSDGTPECGPAPFRIFLVLRALS